MKTILSSIRSQLLGFTLIFANLIHAAPVMVDQNPAICPQSGTIELPDGRIINAQLALTRQDKLSGLSGVQNEEFGPQDAILFLFPRVEPRSVWAPDTYFDLDIIFLDNNLAVVDIERNLPAHPGRKTTPPIPKSKTVRTRHIMEMRADSDYAKHISKGMKLKWVSTPSLNSILACAFGGVQY